MWADREMDLVMVCVLIIEPHPIRDAIGGHSISIYLSSYLQDLLITIRPKSTVPIQVRQAALHQSVNIVSQYRCLSSYRSPFTWSIECFKNLWNCIYQYKYHNQCRLNSGQRRCPFGRWTILFSFLSFLNCWGKMKSLAKPWPHYGITIKCLTRNENCIKYKYAI